MKLNKKAGQSVDASNLFRMGNKIMMGGRGREGSQWEMRGEEKIRETGSDMGQDRREVQSARRMTRNK